MTPQAHPLRPSSIKTTLSSTVNYSPATLNDSPATLLVKFQLKDKGLEQAKEEYKQLKNQVDAAKEETKELKRGSTISKYRADFDKLMLDILPQKEDPKRCRDLGSIRPQKHLPNGLVGSDRMHHLCGIVDRLFRHVLRDQPILRYTRQQATGSLESATYRTVKCEADFTFTWRSLPCDQSRHIVLALSDEYSKYHQGKSTNAFTTKGAGAFEDLLKELASLRNPCLWPATMDEILEGIDPPDRQLQNLITKLVKPLSLSDTTQQVVAAATCTASQTTASQTTASQTAGNPPSTLNPRFQCDFYHSYAKANERIRTAGIVEFKAFHQETSRSLFDFVQNGPVIGQTSIQPARLTSQPFRSFDRDEYSCKKPPDNKFTAVISQMFDYTLRTGCPACTVTTGLMYIFGWTDFETGRCEYYRFYLASLTELPPNKEKQRKGRKAEKNTQGASASSIVDENLDHSVDLANLQNKWAPFHPLVCYVAQLLLGIDDCIKNSNLEERACATLRAYESTDTNSQLGLAPMLKQRKTQPAAAPNVSLDNQRFSSLEDPPTRAKKRWTRITLAHGTERLMDKILAVLCIPSRPEEAQ